jgi:CheY-like chemotaxis protein
MRVLYASSGHRDATRLMFEERVLRIEPLTGGRAARAALDSESFDALMCDLVLPDMDGIALLRDVRTAHPTLPIVMVADDERARMEALQAGADDYLLKSPRLAWTLGIALRAIQGRRRLQAASRAELHLHVLHVGRSRPVREQLARAAGVRVTPLVPPFDPSTLPGSADVALVETDLSDSLDVLRALSPDLPVVLLGDPGISGLLDRTLPDGVDAVLPTVGDYLGQLVRRLHAVVSARGTARTEESSIAAVPGDDRHDQAMAPASSERVAGFTCEAASMVSATLHDEELSRPSEASVSLEPRGAEVAQHQGMRAQDAPVRTSILAPRTDTDAHSQAPDVGVPSAAARPRAAVDSARPVLARFGASAFGREPARTSVVLDTDVARWSAAFESAMAGRADLRLLLRAGTAAAQIGADDLHALLLLLVCACSDSLPLGGSVAIDTSDGGSGRSVGVTARSRDDARLVVSVVRVGLGSQPVLVPAALDARASRAGCQWSPILTAGTVAGFRLLLRPVAPAASLATA